MLGCEKTLASRSVGVGKAFAARHTPGAEPMQSRHPGGLSSDRHGTAVLDGPHGGLIGPNTCTALSGHSLGLGILLGFALGLHHGFGPGSPLGRAGVLKAVGAW